MRRRIKLLPLVVLGLVMVILTACGEKSQADVVKQLDKQVANMQGYKAKAEMKMDTGEQTQKYDLDVWFKEKEYYRVSLANADDEKGNQIILKNEDGVFVLTPALNKSFKFQSEWPKTSSQPYLFQSLVDDVKKDQEAKFESTETHYVFTTKTNYQSNNNLPYQEIHFNKKNYTPELVKVLDKDKKALVEVKFAEFKLDPSFKKDDFAMKEEKSKETTAQPANAEVKSLSVVYPMDTAGAKLKEKKEVELDNGQRIIMTYEGDKGFTLIQESRDTLETLSAPKEVKGDIVNLGHTIGALDGDTLHWTEGGVDYQLASDELTKDELLEVAKSVQGKASK